jgi:tetratricopeptide (TPR) repeat protein
MKLVTPIVFIGVLVAAMPADARQRGGAPQDPASDVLRQAQQLLREGKTDEALAVYRQAEQASPSSFQVQNAFGVALDLAGQYADARRHFTRALELASSPAQKENAQRAMAMSYGFENNCKGATPYESAAYDAHLVEKDFYNAGERANELARLCIEAGDLDAAQKWYLLGRDAGLREPDIKPDRKDLWEFRTEHALARLAARRGNKAEALKHVELAKAVLDRGTNPTQAVFLPYLVGYVALYTGDYKTALAELQKADQNDPFILCLIAQTHEKLGDQAQAKEYYTKALARATTHNPPTVYARPLAKKKLGQ